jgi:hypothetical protein
MYPDLFLHFFSRKVQLHLLTHTLLLSLENKTISKPELNQEKESYPYFL